MTDKDLSRYELGMKVRRSVLGNAHVDAAEKRKTDFDNGFQDLITEMAWGSVWSGEHFSDRERSIVTIGLLAAQGHDEELAMHIRAAKNTGATRDDIREVLMHVAIYAGVPSANHAIKIAKIVFEGQDSEGSEK